MAAVFELLFFDYTVRLVVLGTLILGCVSGALGCFTVLRKQSLLGDAIAHAALPGIAIAFLLSLSKSPVVLLIGAMVAGWIGTGFFALVTSYTKLKKDAVLGIILSVFFGFGLVILTFIQRLPTANKSGLHTFLFGNASTLIETDLMVMSCIGVFVLGITFLLYKEFKLISFDPEFAQVLGFPFKRLDLALTGIIVLAIVIGLQTVGVVLMSAMVIAPAAAARQWTDRLSVMLGLSAVFGAVSGLIGSLISAFVARMPTGPVIVLVISVIVVISLLFSPNRGLLWAAFRRYVNRKNIHADILLNNLYLLSQSHQDPCHAHDLAALEAVGRRGLDRSIHALHQKKWVYSPKKQFWGLTKEGLKHAKRMQQSRAVEP